MKHFDVIINIDVLACMAKRGIQWPSTAGDGVRRAVTRLTAKAAATEM